MPKSSSAFIQAIQADDTLPIEKSAIELWLKDINNPFRWTLRPILQLFFSLLLHLTWFIKRLPLPQFSAHQFLQSTICWFCKHCVSHEANLLILRHYTTESNILNFLSDNTPDIHLTPVSLYPKSIKDMQSASFVDHDQELFRTIKELGSWQDKKKLINKGYISWDNWQPLNMSEFSVKRRWSQVIDFESSHALFMCLFCLLLTRDEYRDAINGFNLDQSIAIRIGEIINDPSLVEYAFNKYPHYPVGPWNLSQRFLMHGFFTEFLYARLKQETGAPKSHSEP